MRYAIHVRQNNIVGLTRSGNYDLMTIAVCYNVVIVKYLIAGHKQISNLFCVRYN